MPAHSSVKVNRCFGKNKASSFLFIILAYLFSLSTSTTTLTPPQIRSEITNTENEEIEDDEGKMPSLFKIPEEASFDRYAACLAATEGLRRIRDMEMGNKRNDILSFFKKSTIDEDDQGRAESKYLINSSKVIKALGLSVPQFNNLGRTVMKDKELKEKVMEQAYLYRMSATLSMPRTPLLKSDKYNLKSHSKRRVQLFASAICEIEELRKTQMEKLCRSLQIKDIPQGMKICDPRVLPFLSPKVKAVCEAFPLQAEEIVSNYGLDSEEFNDMLDNAKTNAIMRWRVNNSVKKFGKAEKE